MMRCWPDIFNLGYTQENDSTRDEPSNQESYHMNFSRDIILGLARGLAVDFSSRTMKKRSWMWVGLLTKWGSVRLTTYEVVTIADEASASECCYLSSR